MDLSSKVKTGLDEARMLVLGCEILVGFQFQAAFQPIFQTRPRYTRFANVIALLLMIAALGLLIAPSCQYIIAERGKSTAYGRSDYLGNKPCAFSICECSCP
jgi:Family of unknown function (DUF6328)